MANEQAAVWGPVVSVLVIALANLIAWAANENSWLFKRCLKPLGVRPLLFISNRAACVDRHTRPISYWAFDLLDPSHLVRSNCLSTPMMLVLHAFTFLYWVATIIVDVVIEYYRVWCHSPSCGRRHGAYGDWASYLTNWSISLLGIAGLVALINTARQLRRERQQQRQQRNGMATGAAAGGAGVRPARIKVDGGRVAHDHSSFRDSLQQQGAVLPATAGDVQLSAGINQQQQQQRGLPAGVTGHPAAATAYEKQSAAEEEPGCCLSPRSSRHSKAASPHPAGVHNPDSRLAGVGNSNPGYEHHTVHHAAGNGHGSGGNAATDTVVVVHDAGSSSEASSNNSGGVGAEAGDCRQVLKHKWDCLSCAHCIIMEVATTAAFFVSFWYWVGIVAIAQSGFAVNGGTLMAHAGNVVVALLQVVLTRLPIVSYHFQVVLWYASLYSLFLWIYGGATDIWRYSLDFQQPRPAGVFVILPIITFIMFLLWYFAALIREGVICAERKAVDKHHARKEQRHQQRWNQHQQQHQHQQQLGQQTNSSMQQGAAPLSNMA